MNEIELIKNLCAGDEKAFSELIDMHQQKVYNLALNVVQSEADAEDITQEVFIEVFHSIKNFKNESKLSTWIFRITMNKSLDMIRSKKTKKRFAFMQQLFGNDNLKPLVEVSHFNHPAVIMEQKENARLIFAMIERLPAKQQAAFALHHINGFSYKEISEIMRMSLSSVESLIHRAKKNLQQLLGDYYENEIKQ